jgi:maltooligosyltrehalose trehalohydrolase
LSDYQPIRPSALGATQKADGSWQFVVWAPARKSVELLLGPSGLQVFDASSAVRIAMERDELGYHRAVTTQAGAGSRYFYRLDGGDLRPDPASRFQPDGVHAASQVVETASFRWTDREDWKGVALDKSVFYELHVGTYTPEGTFKALIPHLDRLAELGVTTIELMPVAQFSGNRNWGYDGVFPFAVQNSYGSPVELQEFVNAAHAKKLAVALDVVYNHLGPEGNYLNEYGPYFTDFYRTPWGAALNFDGKQSDEVRHFFVQSALYWLETFHIDALRLDAVHSIFDGSADPFLAEVSNAVAALSQRAQRQIVLVAESDLNDARVVLPTGPEAEGLGMDGQWSDDFHHSLHTLVTKERSGYYADFGTIHHLAKTIANGWYYDGIYSRHRERKHGNSARKLQAEQFVVCIQNHDQVGNRALGDRIGALTDFEGQKLVAGVTLLSSFTPLIFMGEEYGETEPFQYFTSHADAALAEAVKKGRQAEFSQFEWKGEVPDPQAPATFERSRLNHALAKEEPHRTLWEFYKALLRFRHERELPRARLVTVVEYENSRAMQVLRAAGAKLLAALFHFGDVPAMVAANLPAGTWVSKIDSAAPEWRGPAALPRELRLTGPAQLSMQPRSFVVFECSDATTSLQTMNMLRN